MGENFTRRQAHGFRGRVTHGFDKMKVPKALLAMMQPAEITRQYGCIRIDPTATISEGDDVLIRVADLIQIVRGANVVGSLDLEEYERMRVPLECGQGVLAARVAEISAFGDTFKIQISEGDDEVKR